MQQAVICTQSNDNLVFGRMSPNMFCTAPTITRHYCSSDPGTGDSIVGCGTDGTSRITIVGTNFGVSVTDASITVGGTSCATAALISHERMSCLLPEGANPSSSLISISVTVGGQSVTRLNAIEYSGE